MGRCNACEHSLQSLCFGHYVAAGEVKISVMLVSNYLTHENELRSRCIPKRVHGVPVRLRVSGTRDSKGTVRSPLRVLWSRLGIQVMSSQLSTFRVSGRHEEQVLGQKYKYVPLTKAETTMERKRNERTRGAAMMFHNSDYVPGAGGSTDTLTV